MFSVPWVGPAQRLTQRFVGRPSLEKLFAQRTADKTNRDQLIEKAVCELGYSQMELASFLDLHYSTISRILYCDSTSKNKDLTLRLDTPDVEMPTCRATSANISP